MYECEGLDVATYGKAWQWAIGSAIAIAIMAPLIPLALMARAIDGLMGGDADGEHRG